ncbi:hypothetical protein BH23THE1_BH23THE1_32100 [soil metagenome]
MERHPQVDVVCFDQNIKVDAGIANLLKLIWKEGVRTYNSCQDNLGKIYIEMDLDDFKSIVEISKHQNRDFFNFMEGYCQCNVHFTDTMDDSHIQPDIVWTASIKFDKDLKDEFIKLWISTFGSNFERS